MKLHMGACRQACGPRALSTSRAHSTQCWRGQSTPRHSVTDHVFLAMVTHLAGMYGGLDNRDKQAYAALRGRMLTPLQERRVTSRLLDDLAGDTTLSELAALCGLSRSYFVRAFKQITGMPPHRWLLMH